jgi:Ca-activated chloride channel family protein
VKCWRVFLLIILAFGWCEGRARAQQSAPPPDPSPAPPQQRPVPPIQVTTGLVHLVATVTDRRRNLVTDLDKGDFKVLEDDAPQDIRFFGRETDLPLRIALLLDTSNSIRPRLEFEKDAAIDFLTSVIRRNKDMAFLMTFDNQPEVIQEFTGDLARLTSAIREQRAGGGTALDDAIYLASNKLFNPPPPPGPNPEARRVLVVISDGNDNLSDHALSDALEAAIRAEAAIYAISTNTDWVSTSTMQEEGSNVSGKRDLSHKIHLGPGDKVLQEVADESGGRVFFPFRVQDLAQSFVDIGTELRSQYFIAYAPTNPVSNGKYRKIMVQTNRKGLTVRTRKGYYASAAPSSPPPSK